MKSPFHSITQGFRWMWMWLTRHLSRRENRFDFFLVNELWREKSLSSQNYETWHPGSHTQSLTLSYNISPTSTLVCRFERSVRGNLYSAEGGGSDSAPRTAQMIDSPHKKKTTNPKHKHQNILTIIRTNNQWRAYIYPLLTRQEPARMWGLTTHWRAGLKSSVSDCLKNTHSTQNQVIRHLSNYSE